MLHEWWLNVNWIPRDLNSACDALARAAVRDKTCWISVSPSIAFLHARGW